MGVDHALATHMKQSHEKKSLEVSCIHRCRSCSCSHINCRASKRPEVLLSFLSIKNGPVVLLHVKHERLFGSCSGSHKPVFPKAATRVASSTNIAFSFSLLEDVWHIAEMACCPHRLAEWISEGGLEVDLRSRRVHLGVLPRCHNAVFQEFAKEVSVASKGPGRGVRKFGVYGWNPVELQVAESDAVSMLSCTH